MAWNGQLFRLLTCYNLWAWRNKEIHENDFVRPSFPWTVILEEGKLYNATSMLGADLIHRGRVVRQIRWVPPANGWVKLNTDEACKHAEGNAGCGGLLRGVDGKWLGGFAKKLGVKTAYLAELWGVYEGLKLAYNLGFGKVELNVDSDVVVHHLKNGCLGSVDGWSLLRRIQTLISKDWEVVVSHSYREANKCADALAAMGCNQVSNISLFTNFPASII